MTVTASKISYAIIAANLVVILLYYSPVTLYGYWPDAILLLVVILFHIFLMRKHLNNWLKGGLLVLNLIYVFTLLFNTFSLSKGIKPVHVIPSYDNHQGRYSYFIEGKGNMGILGGCYGEIQYHTRLFGLFEVRERSECAGMDYESIVNNF